MLQRVPFWGQLPGHVQSGLAEANYTHEWFDGQPPAIRQTALNLFVKLKGMDLWRHVWLRDTTGPGELEFCACSAPRLIADLESRSDFTRVAGTLQSWSCREKRATFALHFKHFQDWTQTKVQAHIDKAGWTFGGSYAPPILGPLVRARAHIADYCANGWQDVFGIRDGLLQQGWDREGLLGIEAKWSCGATGCPSHHPNPDTRCPGAHWRCGRVDPPCPGLHANPLETCPSGVHWRCGARDCAGTHRNARETCTSGVWYCGRTVPPCPGHREKARGCDSAAVFLTVR